MARAQKGTAGVPDSVRRAVARTIQTTLGPAGLTRERAEELADDVLRRAEDSAARAGRGVKEAGQRPREAAVGVGDRVREAIAELRGLGSEELEQLRSEVELLRLRVDQLEKKLSARGATGARGARKSQASTAAKTARARESRAKRSGNTR
jgi:polyhydroxyalkanoate synthesis regulator phasin